MSAGSKTPILLVTGFLDSGKTTFINWLLQNTPDKNISVILNEFGDIALESQFIQKKDAFITELPNGCMCCVAKSDIPHVVHLILDKAPHTNYIVIEASGLSDPEPIKVALMDQQISARVVLTQTICIVDLQNFAEMHKTYQILSAQLAEADHILLAKTDSLPKPKIQELSHQIADMLPDIPIDTFDSHLSTSLFFVDTPILDTNTHTSEKHSEHTHEHVDEFLYKTTQPLSFPKYQSLITHLPKGIIRAKGFAYMIDDDGIHRKLLTQYVNGVHEFHIEDWGEESPSTALLFIGKTVHKKELTSRIEACIDHTSHQ